MKLLHSLTFVFSFVLFFGLAPDCGVGRVLTLEGDILPTQADRCDLEALNAWFNAAYTFVNVDKALSKIPSSEATTGEEGISIDNIVEAGLPLRVRVGENKEFGGLGIFAADNVNDGGKNQMIKSGDSIIRMPMSLSISIESIASPSGPLQQRAAGDLYDVEFITPRDKNAFQRYRRPYSAVLHYTKESHRMYSASLLAFALLAEEALSEAQKKLIEPLVRKIIYSDESDYPTGGVERTSFHLPQSTSPFTPWLRCLPQLMDLPHLDLWKIKIDKIAEETAKKTKLAKEIPTSHLGHGAGDEQKQPKSEDIVRVQLKKNLVKGWTKDLIVSFEQFAEPRLFREREHHTTINAEATLNSLERSEDFRHAVVSYEDTKREYQRVADTNVRVSDRSFAPSSPTKQSSVVRKKFVDVLTESLTQYSLCFTRSAVSRVRALIEHPTAKEVKVPYANGKIHQLNARRSELVKEIEKLQIEAQIANEDDSVYFYEDIDSAVATIDSKKQKAEALLAQIDTQIKSAKYEGQLNDWMTKMDAASASIELSSSVYDDCGNGAFVDRAADAVVIPTTSGLANNSNNRDIFIELEHSLRSFFRKAVSPEHFMRASLIHSSRAWNIRGQQYLVPISDFFNYKPTDNEIPHLVGAGSPSTPKIKLGNAAVMKKNTFGERSSDFLKNHLIRQSDGSPAVNFDTRTSDGMKALKARIDELSRLGPQPKKNCRKFYLRSATKIIDSMKTNDGGSGKLSLASTSVAPLLAYLVMVRSEDDSSNDNDLHFIDPKRPPTAPEQHFEVLSDRNQNGANEELYESYGDSPNTIYFAYHGFTPEVNPYECLRQFQSYSVHSVDPLRGEDESEGGDARALPVNGDKTHVAALPKPLPATSVGYKVGMKLTEALTSLTRGMCHYNTTMYQYALSRSDAEGVAPIAESLASPALVSGELCPSLLVWSVGATLFHGARGVDCTLPSTAPRDINGEGEEIASNNGNADIEAARALGKSQAFSSGKEKSNIIAYVFSTGKVKMGSESNGGKAVPAAADGKLKKRASDHASSHASEYFSAMAKCAAGIENAESNSGGGNEIAIPRSFHDSVAAASRSHRAFWEWYKSWIIRCRPSSPKDLSFDKTLQNISLNFATDLIAELYAGDSVVPYHNSEPLSQRLQSALRVWMRLEFSRQQMVYYRSLVLNEFKVQHLTSSVDEDLKARDDRRATVGRLSSANMNATSRMQTLEAYTLPPSPVEVNKVINNTAQFDALRLATEETLISFRIPRKAIFRSHLALARLKLKSIVRRINVVEKQILSHVEGLLTAHAASGKAAKTANIDKEASVDLHDEL